LRDILILLKPDFVDPAFPGTRFYCWHCALLEGVLASFPALASRIEVLRVDWPRPRKAVIDLIGTDNQSLPALILAPGGVDVPHISSFADRRFIHGKDAILAALSARHGFPEPHP
jgi:hypothetical protein